MVLVKLLFAIDGVSFNCVDDAVWWNLTLRNLLYCFCALKQDETKGFPGVCHLVHNELEVLDLPVFLEVNTELFLG